MKIIAVIMLAERVCSYARQSTHKGFLMMLGGFASKVKMQFVGIRSFQ